MSNAPPTARPGYSPTALRILVESARMFAVRGFSASSTRDIAEAVGIRQPGLYKHFASKDAILIALYDLAMTYPTEVGAMLVDRPEPAVVRLHRWLAETVCHLDHAPLVLASLLRTPELADERFAAHRFVPDGGQAFCESLIIAAVRSGDVVDRPPAASARFTLGLIDTLAIPPFGTGSSTLLDYAFGALLVDRRRLPAIARAAEGIELSISSPLIDLPGWADISTPVRWDWTTSG